MVDTNTQQPSLYLQQRVLLLRVAARAFPPPRVTVWFVLLSFMFCVTDRCHKGA